MCRASGAAALETGLAFRVPVCAGAADAAALHAFTANETVLSAAQEPSQGAGRSSPPRRHGSTPARLDSSTALFQEHMLDLCAEDLFGGALLVLQDVRSALYLGHAAKAKGLSVLKKNPHPGARCKSLLHPFVNAHCRGEAGEPCRERGKICPARGAGFKRSRSLR